MEQPAPSNMEPINHLDEAANFLMLVSDDEAGVREKCGLSPSVALSMMEPLHALIDEEMKKNTYRITSKLESTCELKCHCGVYSDLAQSTHLQNDLLKKAEATSKQQFISCANETSNWICKDSLLESLKKSALELEAPAL